MTAPSRHFELPDDLQSVHRLARRLAWASIGFILVSIVLLFLVKGNSQALKAAWLEEVLSLAPPTVFLWSDRYRTRPPDDSFRYGYHRAPGLAFLGTAVILVGIGAFLLLDSSLSLLYGERPSIGTVVIFDNLVWLGWLMISVMVYKVSFALLLGHLKQQPARALHNKALYADGELNKADWASAGAVIIGIVGVGFGYWWADAAAASIISISIIRDGYRIVKVALGDLMDRTPRTVDGGDQEPLVREAELVFQRSPVVHDAHVRMRESGQILFMDASVDPVDDISIEQLTRLHDELRQLHWRMHDVVISPCWDSEQQPLP